MLCERSPPQSPLLLSHTKNASQLGDRSKHYPGHRCRRITVKHTGPTKRGFQTSKQESYQNTITEENGNSKANLRMATAKPILSYLQFPSNKQNRSQSLQTGNRRTEKKFNEDHHFSIYVFYKFFQECCFELISSPAVSERKNVLRAASFRTDRHKRISTC